MNPQIALTLLVLMLIAGLPHSSSADPRRLPLQIMDSVLRDACDAGCSKEERDTYRRNIKFETHDLNGDGVSEFFVYIQHSDWCGAGFNCSYWVFQRTRNAYRSITAGYPVLRVANTVTRGFRDLESHGKLGACRLPNGSSGWQIWLAVLKYNGKEYDATEIGPRCLSK